MGNLIVKDNALIEASHRLNEIEQRLILLAILKIREKFDNVEQAQNQELIIHADDYMQVFNVDRNAAYKALKQAVVGLYRAEWGYQRINKRGNLEVVYERFTQNAKYITAEATVKFMFSTAIIPMLVELERRFTAYEIDQIASLNSRYAMRLFEILMQYYDKKKLSGWVDLSLERLRFLLGLKIDEYQQMNNFKNRVLDLSIDQINENTDFEVSYEQRKQGRKIVAFRFDVKSKIKEKTQKNKERDTNTIDMLDGLTDKEREIVAQKNAYADSINATEQHRQNLVNKALKDHREAQAQAQAQAQERKQAQAQAQAQAQNELERAKALYQQLLGADDDTVKKFVDDNKQLIARASGAEKYYYQNNDMRGVVNAMRYRFENVVMFRAVNVSAIK